MLGYIILDKQLNVVEEGTVKYKSADSFERYALFTDKDSKFKQAYNEGHEIKLMNGGEEIESYLYVPTIHLDKWDNYRSDDPKRGQGIAETIEALKHYRKVRVYFDYEGRTRHETASYVFKHRMIELGYTDFEYEIEYNYHFTIAHKVGVPVL